MIVIDGSQGEGGGQIVRSALALSLVTGRPVTIERVRARRQRPGLLQQHLTAVRAAAAIADAEVDGDRIGSARLVFRPGPVRAGDYAFRIGTAGSTTLVLQTVLPALAIADGDSTLTLEGGTHNPLAPPYDYLARVYLPLLGRLGPRVTATLARPGFFPAGGGELTVAIRPARQLGPLELLDRGSILARRVRALVANLPRHIAERECQTVAVSPGWDDAQCAVEEVRTARGPGNVLLIEIAAEHVTEMFTGFGQRGLRAETVAERTRAAAESYLRADVPVGEHLADQLLLPLGIGAYQGTGGGVFRTTALTGHATTHIAVLREFLEVHIDVHEAGPNERLVRVGA